MVRYRLLAVLAAVGLVAGCGDSGTVTSDSAPASASGGTVPDCGTSAPIRDRPVFAVAVSARGRVCWEAALTNPQPDRHSADPLLVADRAAILGADGEVIAVNLSNGDIRWRWNSGVPGYAGFGLGDGRVGYGTGRVLATKGSGPRTAIVGLDQSSGKVRWSHPLPNGDAASTLDLMDGGLGVNVDGVITSVLNDVDGSTRWSAQGSAPPAPGTATTESPVSHPGYETSVPSSAVPTGVVEVTGGPLVVDGQIVAETQAGVTSGISASTGKRSWQRPGGGLSQLAEADGLVFLTPNPNGAESGYPVPAATVAVDPSSGKTLWTMATTPNTRFSSVGSMLVVQEPDALIRVDPKTGHQVWRAAANFGGTPVEQDGRLIETEEAGSDTNSLMLVGRDPSTGRVAWQTQLPPEAEEAKVYATSQTTVVVAGQQVTGYDPGSGHLKWTVNLPSDTELDGSTGTPGGVVVQAYNESLAIEGH